jgi:hypothetical protein
MVSLLVLYLGRHFSFLFLSLIELTFKEFDFLLEKSLLLVELGLGCHAGSLDFFGLFFLLGDFGTLLVKLPSAIALELL